MVIGTTFLFAILKLQILLTRSNPSINIFETEDAYAGEEDKLVFQDIDFQMAFGFDSWIQSGGRNDPRYIKWVVQLYESKSGNATTKVYPLKTCTEEDLSKFYEPEARLVSKLKHLQSFESLFCLDWESHDFSLFGSWDSDSHYRALDVMAVPCATKLSNLG